VNDINAIKKWVSLSCSSSFVDDKSWKLFGFNSRPRRGIWFDFLVTKERLEREAFLTYEFIYAPIGDLCYILLNLEEYNDSEINYKTLLVAGVIEYLYSLSYGDHNLDRILELVFSVFENHVKKLNQYESFVLRAQRQLNNYPKSLIKMIMAGSSCFPYQNEKKGISLNFEAFSQKLRTRKPSGKLEVEGEWDNYLKIKSKVDFIFSIYEKEQFE